MKLQEEMTQITVEALKKMMVERAKKGFSTLEVKVSDLGYGTVQYLRSQGFDVQYSGYYGRNYLISW